MFGSFVLLAMMMMDFSIITDFGLWGAIWGRDEREKS